MLRRGLEPPCIATYAPETYVSTNSTTSAYNGYDIIILHIKKRENSDLIFWCSLLLC